ncbi:MAG: YlxR family protein [Acidimicrobiales bacterium]
MGCRRAGAPDGMVRIVRVSDGSLVVGRAVPGRGAWLCRDAPNCVDQAIRRKAFERALRGPVSTEQMEMVRAALRGSGRAPG